MSGHISIYVVFLALLSGCGDADGQTGATGTNVTTVTAGTATSGEANTTDEATSEAPTGEAPTSEATTAEVGLGRPDPHGPVVGLCDAAPGRH